MITIFPDFWVDSFDTLTGFLPGIYVSIWARANIFVTTTGNRDIITSKHFEVMQEDAIVSK